MRDDPPDLVISGVNPGPNLSDDWNLSGTVGGARMAAFLGVPAIAVSGYPADDPETLAAVGRWVVALARSRLVRELEPGGYLTVSVPRVAASEIRGATITRRGPRPWALELERDAGAKGESGREHWDLRFVPRAVTPAPGTDTFAYSENRIAVVLMRVDEHDYPTLERLLAEPPELPAWPPAQGAR